MQNPLSRYTMLAKRWAWVIVLGIVICGGGTYIISKLQRPVYQASAFMVLTCGPTSTSSYDCTSASLEALPTYAQLLKNAVVLNPVVAQHTGLTLNQLSAMLTVNPQSNTQIIELDVQNTNPQLAMQLANEVSRSFEQYVNTQLSAAVQILPAQLPTTPISPKPLPFAGLGALVGLGLALALIVIFEWIDDRLGSPEEVGELGLETLTIIPQLSSKERNKSIEETPALAERCRAVCSSLPFKLLMVTSALPGEGKSTIATNLAYFLAVAGKRVLLVDANLRQPSLDQHFQLENRPGFADALLEAWAHLEVKVYSQPTEVPTLSVLTGGVVPANAADMLSSPLTEQLFGYFRKAPYDYVIFDTPPVLAVADTQILATYIEATILIIDASKTPRKILSRARQILNRTRTKIVGVVINKSPWPDYGEIRHYMSEVRQPKASLLTNMHLETSTHAQANGSGNDLEGNTATVTIRNQQSQSGKR
jgi:capsular exopolysaccharide synthesis family protein